MLAIIAARSKNNVIGKNGRIPWRIPGEQQQFRELTAGNVVVMGRRSFEEIGHPLPGRETVVVSRSQSFAGEGLRTARSLQEALALSGERDVFIAGGYSLYAEALPLADVLYLTEVDLTVEDGDTFFPPFDPADFDFQSQTAPDGVPYTRTVYFRRISSPGKETYHEQL